MPKQRHNTILHKADIHEKGPINSDHTPKRKFGIKKRIQKRNLNQSKTTPKQSSTEDNMGSRIGNHEIRQNTAG